MQRYAIITFVGTMAALTAATTVAPAQSSRPSAQSSRPSATACDRAARNYAENASRQGQVIGTGAKGSLLGAGIGAIFGSAGPGAIVGATIGMIGGGAKRNSTAERMYSLAYEDCMAGRLR